MDSSDIVVRRDPEGLVATPLLRRVTGGPGEEPMWRSLDDAVGPDPKGTVILDCRHVQHFFSMGIGRLAAIAARCRRSGARFVVRHLCPAVFEVFQMLRLDTVLEIEQHVDGPGDEGPCR